MIKTQSGLEITVLEKGKGGPSPQLQDFVLVHYEGQLESGQVFDSSFNRGEPIVLQVNQVIPGWIEVLGMMSEGETVEVKIPSELAYGVRGVPGVIPPNAPLIFKIELIEIQK